MISYRKMIKPTAEGSIIKMITLIPVEKSVLNSSHFSWADSRERVGKKAVEMAMAKMPMGNKTKRCPKRSAVMLPSAKPEAMVVEIQILSCVAESPIKAGTIKTNIRLKPGCCRSR